MRDCESRDAYTTLQSSGQMTLNEGLSRPAFGVEVLSCLLHVLSLVGLTTAGLEESQGGSKYIIVEYYISLSLTSIMYVGTSLHDSDVSGPCGGVRLKLPNSGFLPAPKSMQTSGLSGYF